MKVSEMLGKMMEAIPTADDWHQGDLTNYGLNGRRSQKLKVCLVGSAYKACGKISAEWTRNLTEDESRAFDSAVKLLENEIDREYPEGSPRWVDIAHFNDDPHTTFEDVQLVLKRAYNRAVEEGL